MKTVKQKLVSRLMLCLGVIALACCGNNAWADDPVYPDPTSIYTGLSTPFNAALTWVIGAIAVLAVLGWILKAVRRK